MTKHGGEKENPKRKHTPKAHTQKQRERSHNTYTKKNQPKIEKKKCLNISNIDFITRGIFCSSMW